MLPVRLSHRFTSADAPDRPGRLPAGAGGTAVFARSFSGDAAMPRTASGDMNPRASGN